MEEEGKGRGFLPSLRVTGEGGTRRHEPRKRDGGGERERETKERGGEDRERTDDVETVEENVAGRRGGMRARVEREENTSNKRRWIRAQGRGYTGHGLLF